MSPKRASQAFEYLFRIDQGKTLSPTIIYVGEKILQYIVLQKDISGEDSTGQVDYAIKALENLLCITKGKPRNIKIRYAQNLAQLESAFQTNKKKQTADQAFRNDYFDYIYGIVTTGTKWHFIIYTPDGIYSMSGSEYQINLTKSAVKENPELL